MNRRISRAATAGCATALLVALLAPPATADGGCGAAFTWASIADIRALRPLMPAGLAESIDVNGNGALCYKEMPSQDTSASPNAGHLNMVDDRGPAR